MPVPGDRASLAVALRRHRAGGQGRRRGARRQGAGHVHPDRRDRAPAVRAAPAPAAAGLHRRRAGAQPAGAVVGRGDVPGARGVAHRRHGRPGRLLAAVHRPAQGRRPGGRRGRQPAEHRRLHEPDPRARGRAPTRELRRGDTQAAALLAVLDARGARAGPLRRQDAEDDAAADLRRAGGRPGAHGRRARRCPTGAAVHSLHSYFLRPGDPNEEIRYAVERIRDGRTFSTRRVVAWQRRKGEDVAIFALTADASAGETAVRRALAADARRAGPREPAHVPRSSLAAHGDEARAAKSDRPGGRAADARGPVRPRRRRPTPDTKTWIWMRVAGELPDDPAVHAAALTFVSDLTPAVGAGIARMGGGWADGRRARAWTTRCGSTSRCGPTSGSSTRPTARRRRHGRALCFGQIWAVDGTHVATVTQQGLIRPLNG